MATMLDLDGCRPSWCATLCHDGSPATVSVSRGRVHIRPQAPGHQRVCLDLHSLRGVSLEPDGALELSTDERAPVVLRGAGLPHDAEALRSLASVLAPCLPACEEVCVETQPLRIPAAQPFVPSLYPGHAQLMLVPLEAPHQLRLNAIHMASSPGGMLADTDFWAFLQASVDACRHARDEPCYQLRVASGDGGGVLSVNQDFLASYVRGWEAVNSAEVSLMLCGADGPVAFRAPPDLWGYLHQHLRTDAAGLLRVSASQGAVPMATSPDEWNRVAEAWEKEARVSSSDRRQVLREMCASGVFGDRVHSSGKHGKRRSGRHFWTMFVDEWDKQEAA